jgi:hypothetical protein
MEKVSFALRSAKVKIMASQDQVKQYIAYWWQLGKKVVIRNGEQKLLPKTIIVSDRYSQEFEACWQQILSPDSGDCYLEGTDETIAQLLTPEWDIILCCRCVMPIPLRTLGMPPNSCPCNDLPSWPNPELPHPRSPVDTTAHLSSIRYRLLRQYAPEIPLNSDAQPVHLEPPIPFSLPRCQSNHG